MVVLFSMGKRGADVELVLQHPKSLGAPAISCLLAALFMLVGASYAAAHNDDEHEHEGDSEVECVACAVIALGGAKLSPDAPRILNPDISLTESQSLNGFLVIDGFNFSPNPARGPPLSRSSF